MPVVGHPLDVDFGLIAPGKCFSVQAAACREFPFGFGRQAVAGAREVGFGLALGLALPALEGGVEQADEKPRLRRGFGRAPVMRDIVLKFRGTSGIRHDRSPVLEPFSD